MTEAEFARRLLADIDAAVAAQDGLLIAGAAQSYEQYRKLVDHRAGLLQARQLVVDRLDKQSKQALGLPIDPPARPRGSPLGGPKSA